MYSCLGRFVRGFEFSDYLSNVQYTGEIFAGSVRDEDGQYVYAYACCQERMHKFKYNGTKEFVCYEDRVYTRGHNNSGVYDFGIYTYLLEQMDGAERYTFKLYRD